MSVRTGITVAVASVAAAAVAFTAPSLAAHSQAAHKAAPPAARTVYFQVHKTFDNFDSCPFVPILNSTVTAPAKGFFSMTSAVSADMDVTLDLPAILATEIVVDGKVASAVSNAPLDHDGTRDETVIGIGGKAVKKGKHKVQILASECTSGQAYITDESLTVGWTSVGHAKLTPPAKGVGPAKSHANR